MIDSIIIGSGNQRKVVPLVRDKSERRSAAGAIKGFLFPTAVAHRKARDAGRRRAAKFIREQKEAMA